MFTDGKNECRVVLSKKGVKWLSIDKYDEDYDKMSLEERYAEIERFLEIGGDVRHIAVNGEYGSEELYIKKGEDRQNTLRKIDETVTNIQAIIDYDTDLNTIRSKNINVINKSYN